MRGRQDTYQITVQGRLDESWSDWFDGMTIIVEDASEDAATTMLTGPVADQSALLSILTKLGDLNLRLVSLSRVEEYPGEET